MARKLFNPVIQTTDKYQIFKNLTGNRDVNENHYRRLKVSMNDNPLISPIIVNERMEVIDGQHRLRVCRDLKLPVHYIMVYGYGVKEVQILNANNQNWKKSDYLDGYIKEGKLPYIQFREFQQKFPSLSFSSCMKILGGKRGNSDEKGSKGEVGIGIQMKNFERGNFDIPDLKRSYQIGEMIMDYKPLFEKYNDTTFVVALLGLFEHPNYNHTQMLHKISIQPNMLTVCRSVKQYVLILEEIYNYKSRNKFSFRY